MSLRIVMELILKILVAVYFQKCLAQSEKCSALDSINTSQLMLVDVSIGKYMVRSIIMYECFSGYKREAGRSSVTKCEHMNGTVKWTHSLFNCIKSNKASVPQRIFITHEEKNANSETQNWEKDYCGAPTPVANAYIKLMSSPVGQEIFYNCPAGFAIKPGTSGLSRCTNGKWTSPSIECNIASHSATATNRLASQSTNLATVNEDKPGDVCNSHASTPPALIWLHPVWVHLFLVVLPFFIFYLL
ncbi:uncharacterized protein LOC122815941 isoform X2 [Protopterus annectens]|uniref:uncharacterized protein LOC122815941 isoform X2 n=1 Tax=Protopterus annectens TaxID=7888 RepID=UPI001CFBD57F|nr:uncharacterized protein LOC122815941 isoform X2 [Protopterus annectens]